MKEIAIPHCKAPAEILSAAIHQDQLRYIVSYMFADTAIHLILHNFFFLLIAFST